ncbi:7349_t:CDS:10 [Diversispora eburnea]|uniref:7349_t:CDS:1 n=1 Tax=Diversispora eburnea TaxID=1213867 RepID=A0A9N8UZY1_9GLOM|nr:7349_t:CDS:10 [Diversispora eburnea]
MNTSYNLDNGESQKQPPQTWNIKDLNQNVELFDRSPFSSTGSLIMPTNVSIKSENDKEIQYSENFVHNSSPREKEIFSDTELSTPNFYNLSPPQRRRTLSGISRHQESSYEERENDFDRVRIGHAGKGFSSLISDERSKEIKKLIENVKDEDAFRLAQITQRHANANLQSRRNSNFEDYNHGIRSNKITSSKDCKKFFEEKYFTIFKIINNNGIYNPLKCVKNRRINMTNLDDSNNDSSTSLISNSRGKNNNIMGRQKGTNIWNISPAEILYEYEKKNNIINSKSSHLTIETIPELSSPTNFRNFRNSRSKIKKHSKALSLNNIGQDINNNDEQNKSKRWSLHLFKRKDKKLKRKFSKKDNKSGKIDEILDDDDDVHLHLSNSQKNLIDSSSSDHTSRSSAEYSRSLSDREQLNLEEVINNDLNSRQNVLHEEKYKSVGKFEKEESTDTSSQRDSLDTSAEFSDNQSSDSENIQVESIRNPEILITMSEDIDYLPQGEKGYSDTYRSSSAEYENDSDEEDYEPYFIRETVHVNLDYLPDDLVQLISSYQKEGIIPKNEDNSHYVELDLGKDLFKFKKFNKHVKHGDDLLNICVSLVTNSNRSIDLHEVEESIARYDYLQSPVCNKSFHFPSKIQYTETEHELKDRIDRGSESLKNSTDDMENIVKRLESQHNNITEEMKIMLNEIEKITNEVNKDYFNELQNLEDEIQFLIAEKENSPWLETFYSMMSYELCLCFGSL